MRKNSPRKWLHAILDLLPVLILPIFALAVRSDNNFQPIEVQAQDYEVVDFNQLQQQPKKASDFYSNDALITWDDENSYFVATLSGGNIVTYPIRLQNLIPSHKYIASVNIKASSTDVQLYEFYNPYPVTNINVFDRVSFIFTNQVTLHFTIRDVGNTFNPVYFNSFMCTDLTQMFGAGNEPTIEQFNTWFSNDYYEYTLSKKVLLNVGSTTLSDTDVGSQMVYTLYNATDKYFNFNNVFNFGQLYDWFVLNIFNGNATLIFSVVWQIVLYEFIMDLVFLIYALFMFFIDFCTNLIDRFHVKCSGGK